MWQTVGFSKQKIFFEEKMKSEAFPAQTFLFSGPEMIGKKTFALELAQKVTGCLSVNYNPQLYFGEKEGLTMAHTRDLHQFLSLKSPGAVWRVAVLDEAQNWRTETANALLKILEEPPTQVLFFLITSNRQAVLPTIASRCLEIRFVPHDPETVLDFLNRQSFTAAQSEFLAHFINGQIGVISRWQEQGVIKDLKKILAEFNGLISAPLFARLAFAEKIIREKTDLGVLLRLWLFYLRSSLTQKLPVNRFCLLSKIIETNHLISQPQTNQRLALEGLLLSI